MGGTRWDPNEYRGYQARTTSKPREQIFTQRGLHPDLDPRSVTVRESCDSSHNPESTPIVIGVDETGSMGILAEQIIKHGLGVIIEQIYNRKPIPDPHVMLAGLGDAISDQAPLQVTQFEAGVEPLTRQIEQIWLEGNGGGNEGESYPLLWWFLGSKVRADAIIKRQRKGFVFTVGDERFHEILRAEQIQRIIGDNVEMDVPVKDLLARIQQNWHVFHLITPTYTTKVDKAIPQWRELLGERAIEVRDHSKLAEVIVSTIEIVSGKDVASVVNSWDGETRAIVQHAVAALPAGA